MDGFVASYDRTGKFRWAHRIGSDQSNTGTTEITSLSIDSHDRLTLVGHFMNDVNTELPNAIVSITNAGNRDIMIIQLDQDGWLARPPISTFEPGNEERALMVDTRAGVNVTIESSDLSGAWISVTNIPLTTGAVSVTTSDTNPMFRAVIDW